jgi:4'-phosphopantetheinyl transferase
MNRGDASSLWSITKSRPDVCVWIAKTDESPSLLMKMEGTLSESELARVGAFHFKKDRSRYTFAHGVLRDVLSRRLQIKPKDIIFETNRFGKPFVAPTGSAPLQFNMSHSENLVLIAVTEDRLIGIDVECIRNIDVISIAGNYFTVNELQLVNTTEGYAQQHTFYRCWTRKEAYIKAIGTGLSVPLTSFDCSMPLGGGERALPATPDSPGVDTWWLSTLDVPHGYVASLVVQGQRPQIESSNWIY